MIDGPTILGTIELLVALLGLAVLVVLVARAVNLPDTVALVLGGLIAGSVARVAGATPIEIPYELVLVVLLPGLVFEAAYRLDLRVVRRLLLGLGLLAIPGVIVSAAVIAGALSVFAGLPVGLAFVVGAVLSATDPVAVVATFKRVHAPRTLATLIDGESLLNDGTSLVLFAIALSALTVPVGLADGTLAFVGAIGGGIAIGVVTGALAAMVIRAVDDPWLELTISVVLAYGSFLLADELGVSPVLATVTAALLLGNFGGRVLSPGGVDSIDTVWAFLGYLLTAIAFLLIGVAISPERLIVAVGPIGVAIAGALIGRALVVYGLLGTPSRAAPLPGLESRIPLGWLHVSFWAGLRGAVAVAMALALPEQLPQRELLQDITFGVVLFTLLAQATTVGQLVRRSVPEAPTPPAAAEPS